jgi:hypothetical protein
MNPPKRKERDQKKKKKKKEQTRNVNLIMADNVTLMAK